MPLINPEHVKNNSIAQKQPRFIGMQQIDETHNTAVATTKNVVEKYLDISIGFYQWCC